MGSSRGRVAVIGAGLAGSLVAAGLHAVRWTVEVFDKSRGTGGRLASARLGEASMDLGASALTESQFRQLCMQAPQVESCLRRWDIRSAEVTSLQACTDDRCRYVPIPRFSALTRSLLSGIRLHTSVRIACVEPAVSGGWQLGDDQGRKQGRFDRVVVATPAPQALPLLQSVPWLADWAARVVYEPIWMLLLRLQQAPAALGGLDWLEHGQHPVLARVVHDSAKPDRQGANWVLQAQSRWSREQLESEPEEVGRHLLAAFEAICAEPVQPQAQRVHRWLYAKAVVPLGHVQQDATLGICGDWALGAQTGLDGLSAAMESAQQLLESWT